MKPIAIVAVLAVACMAPDPQRSDGDKSVFETRALATDDYQDDGVSFDLDNEQERLRMWLDTDGNRQRVAGDPQHVAAYNQLHPEQGGPLSPELSWLPHEVRASRRNEDRWDYCMSMQSPADRGVPVFTEEDWNGGLRSPGAPEVLVELLPINMHASYFTQDDLDPESFRVEPDHNGQPAISYSIAPERRAAYGDWTESLITKKVAIIVNGVVLSVPVIQGRIASSGQISGAFTEEEAASLVDSIRGR